MSYVIHIWDQPTPTSLAQAQAVFERLWDQRAALNPKFVELAQRMKTAFPQYGDDWDLGSPKDLPNDAVLAVDIHDLGGSTHGSWMLPSRWGSSSTTTARVNALCPVPGDCRQRGASVWPGTLRRQRQPACRTSRTACGHWSIRAWRRTDFGWRS